jgi:hypothetical protein
MEEIEAALLRVAVNPPSSLLPQLQEDERGLLRAAKRVLPGDDSAGLVLLLDQFEEVFTQAEDEAARAHFLGSLYAAASDPRSPLRIIATLRADFYDRPLLYRQPGELVRERTEVVLPMSAAELERAIVRPAARVGVGLEPNLLAALVQDVGEQPGTLPLLQYALTELFERREGRLMTLRAYQATSGVAGALGRRAETIYNSLDYAGQEAARQLFLRLVTVGEGAEEDTRRRVRMSELSSTSLDEEALHRALDLFGRYRLLTFDREAATGAPTVEVAHEALLRSWGRVREWLEASRESLRVQRRLMSAAGDWLASGRDPSFLAPGARLSQFEALAAERDIALTADERAYLEASMVEREHQIRDEQERQGRELVLQRRAANHLRVLVAAMAVFLAIAVGLSLLAVGNQAEADRQRVQAEIGFTRSEALRLAAEAGTLLQVGNQSELAALLAIRSAQTEHTIQGDAALGPASFLEYPQQRYLGHEGSAFRALFSPDDERVLTASWDATARLWDAQTGKELRRSTGIGCRPGYRDIASHGGKQLDAQLRRAERKH